MTLFVRASEYVSTFIPTPVSSACTRTRTRTRTRMRTMAKPWVFIHRRNESTTIANKKPAVFITSTLSQQQIPCRMEQKLKSKQPVQYQRRSKSTSHNSKLSDIKTNTTSNPLHTTTSPSENGGSNNHNDKPYYVTTPIFYVNANPHVGHLFSMVLADILKRWQLIKRPKGSTALLCTGTDEHGMKVQQACIKAGNDSPKAFCDQGAEVFRALAQAANISNDHFVRTTDPDHKDAVHFAWSVLKERGYIYMDKHEGWYCVSDETFYPQSQVHSVLEPATGRVIIASKETGKEVQWTSETNYKFRLSAMASQLLEFYESHADFIVPEGPRNEVVKAVSEGLEDLSVSRPASRLTWGIPVPTDDTQTIYVWLDALVNYITKAGYPWPPGSEHRLGWPADVQVIGKDIVRFHCIYWPAFLLALGIPPPKQILTHAHWTLGKAKMSKSTGNVVNPFFAIDRFGVDVMRFYLAHDGGLADDADYSNEQIIVRYKKSLQSSLGNLASRVTRGKGWNVRRAIEKSTGPSRLFSKPSQEEEAAAVRDQIELLRATPGKFDSEMQKLNVSGAVKSAMDLVYATNAFLQIAMPWDLAKQLQKLKQQQEETPDTTLRRRSSSSSSSSSSVDSSGAKSTSGNNPEEAKVVRLVSAATDDQTAILEDRLDRIIFLAAEALRVCGILLQPVMPSKAGRLLDMLGVDDAARAWPHAEFAADAAYGEAKIALGQGHVDVLFPPLTSDS